MKLSIGFLSAIFLVACTGGDSTPLSYDGSSTIGMNIMPEATATFAKQTGITFTSVENSGSGHGFEALMAGKVPIGGLSRDLKEKEKAQRPYYRIIGYDAVALYVNAKNPIKGLSRDQVRNIFSGKVTHWNEVGGSNAPISVITEKLDGKRATLEVFKKIIMGETAIGTVTEIDQPVDCVKAVAADPNAITYGALAFLQPQSRALELDGIAASEANVQLGSYVLNRPLLLAAKKAPEGNVKKFFDFMLSPDGQAIVKKSKFVPIR